MTIMISPDIETPSRITASGAIDAIAALDIVDLLDLTHPEAVAIDVSAAPQISAAALKVLVAAVRRERAGAREISFVGAQPLVSLLLTVVGLITLDEVAGPVAA